MVQKTVYHLRRKRDNKFKYGQNSRMRNPRTNGGMKVMKTTVF